jgi:branched-chain amino acid transport system ATP-binding protein
VAEPVLETVELVKSFGAMTVTARVDLTVLPGEVHAVIGPNGAGKTTLIKQLAGELRPDSGAVRFMGRDVTGLPVHRRAKLGIARLFQLTSVFQGLKARENVVLALQGRAGGAFRFWSNGRSNRGLEQAADELLERVGLAGRGGMPAAMLSHGEKRQLEVAMVLAGKPKLLLLDEPTSGMGGEESRQIVKLLSTLREEHSILLVEHDMEAVAALADRVTVMVYGQVAAAGTVAEIRADPQVRRAYLGDDDNVGVRHAPA